MTDDYRTHPDYLALLRAIRAAGHNDLERLKLADWLEERAGAVACPKCEGHGHFNKCHDDFDLCSHCSGTGRVGDGLAERGEFIRVQCDIVADSKRLNCPCPNCTDPAGRQTVCAVVRREFELFSGHCETWHPNPTGGRAEWQWRLPGTPENGNGSWVYSRGFVSTVRGPLASLWRACERCDTWGIDTLHDKRTGRTDHVRCPACSGRGHAGALAALGPEVLAVSRVEVTDREPAAEDYLNTLTNEEGTDWVWREDNGHLAMDRPHQIPGWLFDHIDLPKMRDFPTLKVATSPAIARAALSDTFLSLACEPYLRG